MNLELPVKLEFNLIPGESVKSQKLHIFTIENLSSLKSHKSCVQLLHETLSA